MDSVANLLQVCDRTWRRWLKLGETELQRMDNEDTDLCAENSVLYVEFWLLHKRALARGLIHDMALIETAAVKGAWKAAAWRLERRFPEKFGSQNREIRILEKQAAAAMARIAELEAIIGRNKAT